MVEKRSIKILGVSLIVSFFVIMGSLAWFNLRFDYANVFVPKGIYDQFVWHLQKGEYILGPQHWADRYLKQAMIKANPVADTVILGSSRILNLNKDVFKEQGTFLNLWVGGASVHDYLGLVGVYAYHKLSFPKRMIFTIEPWLLNVAPDDSTRNEWQKLAFYHDYMINSVFEGKPLTFTDKIKDVLKDIPWERASNLFNPEIATYNFSIWRKGQAPWDYNEYEVLKEPKLTWNYNSVKEGFGMLLSPDGSGIVIPEAFGKTIAEVDETEKKRAIDGRMSNVEDFYAIDPMLQTFFVKMIDVLQKKGVEIYFYIPPYYTASFERMYQTDQYPMVKISEQWMRNFAKDKGIKVFGSYNPTDVGLSDRDFVDFGHLRPEPINRMFKALWGQVEHK